MPLPFVQAFDDDAAEESASIRRKPQSTERELVDIDLGIRLDAPAEKVRKGDAAKACGNGPLPISTTRRQQK
jgi:hypothetical protein